ncbi:bergaptol O-methyltransferase-like [Cryptomeria japonica]|uniref:bergaptol O-methyltransferase-like n=1 Tax=Cryptomeria japonica TaxID=3369 RepID=UPI0025AD0043|nr:bergaptol O-methyltransferase-like [Cryptomeria japonica]
MTLWHHLHECVLQDCHGFKKAHVKDLWAYGKDDPLVKNVVNDCMSTLTDLDMEKIMSCYDGFKEVKTLVDVGIESVGGSMFDSIPSADAIFVKNVFKDWDEEKCEQILGNCHKALPEMENS